MNTTLTAPTTTEYITATPRLCSTCGTLMEQHGRAFVCPKQRDEEKRVSAAMRRQVQATTAARVDTAPF